jgi:glycerol-3-phosphate cytidylyltransferase
MKVITFGSFDLLHIGHINILRRAKELGDELIVGVSTDDLHFSKKKEYPVYNQDDRLNIVKAIRFVDEVFFEESLELKKEYILKYKADVLVMGDDWKGKFDWVSDVCKVIYLKRTPNISTTKIKMILNNKEK